MKRRNHQESNTGPSDCKSLELSNDVVPFRRTVSCRFLLWFLLGLLSLPAYAQSIFVDHRGGELPTAKISQAAWIVGERRGIDFHVVGESTLGCIPDAVVMRRAQWAEWLKLSYKWQSAGAVAAECAERSMVVVFNPVATIYQTLIEHEILHTSSCWNHSDNPNDALYWDALAPLSITYEDATCAQTDPVWPTAPSPCFAELAPDYTLYIPAIGGVRARLSYEGVVGGFHQWSAPVVSPTVGVCAGFAVSGNIATLPDVRAYPDKRYSAKLERTNEGKWKLTELMR